MKFRFQSYIDVSTSASTMQVLQFAVGGANVVNRCSHLFGAYKYFKLGRISVKMVPASTLPVDPLQLSYAEDDPQSVDPRDQMNPGLVRITNGEDVFTNVSALDDTQQDAVYKTMMLDPRWSKFMLQSGFRRSAYPLYWQIGQLSQDKFPGYIDNIPVIDGETGGNPAEVNGSFKTRMQYDYDGSVRYDTGTSGSSARGMFQVGHKGRLGFLPTDFYQRFVGPGGEVIESTGINNVPEVSVITCILPKAYKTLYYYRIFITEEVIFSGLRASPVSAGPLGLDNFVFGGVQVPEIGHGVWTPGTSMIDNNGGDRAI